MLHAQSRHRDWKTSAAHFGTSPTSTSSSSLSSKEERLKQLQILQRQQQEQNQEQYSSHAFSLSNDPTGSKTLGTTRARNGNMECEPEWMTKDSRDKDSAQASGIDSIQDRRQSHLSDRHMNLGPMRLLSDETPPDDLDGSWGLDNLDDDFGQNLGHTRIGSPNRSTHIGKSPRVPYDDTVYSSDKNLITSKFPWRDSKLHDIFSDLAKDDAIPASLMSSTQTERSHPLQKSPTADFYVEPLVVSIDDSGTTSSSLSFGDIMDALNNGDESFDLSGSHTRKSSTKQAKIDLAKQRLVELLPACNIDLSGNITVSPTESVKQEHASLGSTPRNSHRRLLTVVNTPGSYHSATSSRPPRSSYGSYRRSLGSRDSEFGDRGSTTSRDSLSGSTLGSIGFHAQLDGLKKAELASVLLALKSGMVDSLLNDARILPNNLKNSTAFAPKDLKREHDGVELALAPVFPDRAAVEQILADDTERTPRPNDRALQPRPINHLQSQLSPTPTGEPSALESDPARKKQYARLASIGLTKQSSSFVEELANATDSALRSGADISVKLPPSPTSRKTENQQQPRSPLKNDMLPEALKFEASENDSARTPGQEILRSTFAEPTFRYGEEPGAPEDQDMDDDLGFLTGSRAVVDAFKNLENLDMSFDIKSEKDSPISAKKVSARECSSQTGDERLDDNYFSSVQLPSKPKRKGEHSLKWEDQIDDSPEPSYSASRSVGNLSRSSSKNTIHNTSNLMPEESSFRHAEGHLIHVITPLHPWDEWDQVKSLDLTKRKIESTIRLNHLVPNLEVLLLNDNQVSYLIGIPGSLKTLQARSNQLSNLTSFSHLKNMQYLDISNNEIDDLTGLSSLVHLRELKVVNNKIKSVSALQQMDGLIRLDVSHNCLTSLDFRWSKLQRLEFLNVSHNKIEQLENLESLAGLIHANLVKPLLRLRILRLSENKLLCFDASPFPGLRTLYLDDNRLQLLENCQTLTRLENFSARDQEGEGIAIDMTDFINSRKLYLSGNPIHALDFNMGFYRMEYLEICAGCLSELPIDFATLMPNLRGLNLSYNGLDSISALDGLLRLRRLIFVGNNLKSFSDVSSLVKRMRSLVTLDLRHNPLTSNMYPAMSIKQGSKYQDTYRTNQNSETELDWRRRDIGFRRALPDAMYIKRSVYRSAILKSCSRLEWFDGGVIQTKERERVHIVLGDLVNNYGPNFISRREDEEDWDYEQYDEADVSALPGRIDSHQGQHHNQLQQHELIYNREEMVKLAGDNEEYLEDQDQDYYNEHDPEDISDHSKRQTASSIDNESIVQRERLRQQQIMIARQAAPKSPAVHASLSSQPRRLIPSHPSGVAMSSPSPHAGALSRPTNVAIAQSQHISYRNAQSPEEELLQHRQQQGDAPRDGTDKQSAVKSWRDDVHEASMRNLQSPRTTPDVPETPRQSMLFQHENKTGSLHSGQSRNSSRSGASNTNAQELTGMMSTTAIANNSGGDRHRQMGTPLRIPTPAEGAPRQRTLSYQQRGRHSRGKSDGGQILGAMIEPISTPKHQGGRPQSLHRMSSSQQLQNQQRHPLCMSPMGIPADQGTLRPTHHRRRSLGVYHHLSSSSLLANTRKREITGDFVSPVEMALPFGVQSPGYFGLSHSQASQPSHGLIQSPYGFGKSFANGGRSVPNTPSKSGRASRVSQGFSSQTLGTPQCQTLARDMERSTTEE
ncbi:hypothetical protein BG004_001814 [Podila humilis]|nr:hypothetical protein BG004_001814 [Podila humilis]